MSKAHCIQQLTVFGVCLRQCLCGYQSSLCRHISSITLLYKRVRACTHMHTHTYSWATSQGAALEQGTFCSLLYTLPNFYVESSFSNTTYDVGTEQSHVYHIKNIFQWSFIFSHNKKIWHDMNMTMQLSYPCSSVVHILD